MIKIATTKETVIAELTNEEFEILSGKNPNTVKDGTEVSTSEAIAALDYVGTRDQKLRAMRAQTINFKNQLDQLIDDTPANPPS